MTARQTADKLKPKLGTADFAWFDYSNYSDARLQALGLSGWINVLSDRLTVKAMAAGLHQDMALEAMAELQKDPLQTLGFDLPRLVGEQPADTPTVFFIRAGMVAFYSGLVLKHKLKATDVLDLALRENEPTTPMPWATIQVDLRAKRTQIESDFKAWLRQIDVLQPPPKKHDYTKPDVFNGWIESEYLPYFDLTLYALLRGRAIPDDLMQRLLRRTHERSSERDMLRAPRRSLDVFTIDTLHAMWRQREEPMATIAPAPKLPRAARPVAAKKNESAPKVG